MSRILNFLAETRSLSDDELLEKCVVVYRLWRSYRKDHRRYEECVWIAGVCEERGKSEIWSEAVKRVKEEARPC